jgi:hypothetical protein
MLKHWDHGFESIGGIGCRRRLLFLSVCVVLCRRSFFAVVRSPTQGILPNISKEDSETQYTGGPGQLWPDMTCNKEENIL